jgi:hypothetical protein
MVDYDSPSDIDQVVHTERKRRPAPHEHNAGATILPLRGLALFTRPNRDITHAFFRTEEHGAWDAGAGSVMLGRGGIDGRPTAFHLQSGGASCRRLDKVIAWVSRRS